MITPLPAKFELRAYGQVYDVSNCIANWREIEVVLKRSGTSGVFYQLSFPFEFVLDGYDVLKEIFEAHQYRSVADVYIYIRRDDWAYNVDKYHLPNVFNLDFTSYEETDDKIEIESTKVSLFDCVRSKGKVTYDIPVSDICESRKWGFERIELENTIVFRCVAELQENATIPLNNRGHRTFGVSYEKTEVAVRGIIFTNDVAFNNGIAVNSGVQEQHYFMYVNENAAGRYVEFDIDIEGIIGFQSTTGYNPFQWFSLELIKVGFQLTDGFNISTSDAILKYKVDTFGLNEQAINWKDKKRTFLDSGEGCYLVFTYEVSQPGYYSNIIKMIISGTVKTVFNAKNDPVEIDMIKPNVLLQRLVNDMTGTNGVYGASIDDFNANGQDLVMMTAAESIRGIEPSFDETGKQVSVGAQVHTSYNQFLQWMNAYGYEEHITATAVVMKKRAMGFRADLTAIELGADECADLKVTVDEDYLFSGVKIGYQRKEIENANVRFEFNGQHDYATDLSMVDKVLDLVSPYRADCYGIEFLAQERLKETTDNKADKDLFLVNVREVTETVWDNSVPPIGTIRYLYRAIKSVFSGNVLKNITTGLNNNSLFNGNLNPSVLLQRNLNLIGVSCENVQFTASDSNAEIVIDGHNINEDCVIGSNVGLFDAIMYDVASRNIQSLPEGDAMNGVVRFEYKGEVYEGFIDEISKNPAWESDTTWKLRKRK